MNKRWMVLVLTGLVFLLGGCSSEEIAPENNFSVLGQLEGDTDSNETLTLSMRSPETLNPIHNKDESVDQILRLIYQPLIEFDEMGKIYSNIAQSWSIAEERRTLFVQLRTDVFWQNGGNLTADDVIHTLNEIVNAEDGTVYKRVLDYVESYQKVNEYAVTIVFKEAFNANMMSLNFPIISRSHTAAGRDVNLAPMGSGPYAMVSYTMASQMILEANPAYVGGVPNISSICVKVTSGSGTDIYAFERGMIDILVQDAIEVGRLTDGEKYGIHLFDSPIYDFVGFNFDRGLFREKNMRQAVAYALPKAEIYENVYLQYARLTATPISARSYLYEENVIDYGFDTNMAAMLLKNAGWADANGDGVLERILEGGGEEILQVRLLVNQENIARMQIATRLRTELTALGFAVILEAEPYDVYAERFQNGEFDLVIAGWKMSPTVNLTDFFGTGGRYNYIAYSDAQTDALLRDAAAASGEGLTLLAYSRLQKRLAEELPYISIAYRMNAVFTSEKVGGEISPTMEHVYRTISDWTYGAE